MMGMEALRHTTRTVAQLVRLIPVPHPAHPRSLRALHVARCLNYASSKEKDTIEQPVKRKKQRLDELCLELHPEYSRNVIQSWIVQGKVLVDDRPVLKAGTSVPASASIMITAEAPKYVCRAGLKMEAALEHFNIDPTGCAVLDSGLSTGGFTDCLLQKGAFSVVGVDVGYGQVAERVRVDPRVTVMERTNLRHLRRTDLPGEKFVDLVTLDLSFISVLKVRDTVCDVLTPTGQLIVLIKPQFEAGKKQVGTGGVVKDSAVHAEVIERVVAGWAEVGFECSGWMESPIKGATSGNTEFLAHFVRQGDRASLQSSDKGEDV